MGKSSRVASWVFLTHHVPYWSGQNGAMIYQFSDTKNRVFYAIRYIYIYMYYIYIICHSFFSWNWSWIPVDVPWNPLNIIELLVSSQISPFPQYYTRVLFRSWDRSIVVHDESSKTEVVHRRATNSHKAPGPLDGARNLDMEISCFFLTMYLLIRVDLDVYGCMMNIYIFQSMDYVSYLI